MMRIVVELISVPPVSKRGILSFFAEARKYPRQKRWLPWCQNWKAVRCGGCDSTHCFKKAI